MQAHLLSDDTLTVELGQLVTRERTALVAFLEHLAEFDRRHLHLRLGYPSLFQFLRERFKFSKGSAYRRSTAARLLSRHPIIGPLLERGQLSLVTVCLLKDILTVENQAELLDLAAGKTQEEVEVLVATLSPKPLTRDGVRKVQATTTLPIPSAPSAAKNGSTVEPFSALEKEPTPPASMEIPRPLTSTVKPVSEERYVLKITVDGAFIEELERVKAALSHKMPAGKLNEVLSECMHLALEVLGKCKRGAAKRPKASGATSPASQSRYITADVRRQVWERDQGACTYQGSSGKRWGARRKLEFHHGKPFALGGPATVENMTLHCRAHNQLVARLELAERGPPFD